MNPVIMHINYGELTYNSYGKKSIDDICRIAAETGFDGIEFRGNPPKEFADLPFVEYVRQIADAKKKYGLSQIIFGIAVDGAADPDKETRVKSINAAIEKAKIANDLCETSVCNTFSKYIISTISGAPNAQYQFHGSAAATPEIWERTAESFREVGEGIAPLGMKFAFETHMNYIHDVPSAVRKLVDMIGHDSIGVNMDYGNTVYFPERPTPEETIDIYGDKLFYLHLKNSSAVPGSVYRMPTALSDGEINHREYLRKLLSTGYTGPIGIEAPRGGDRVWFAKQDLGYFKSIIESL